MIYVPKKNYEIIAIGIAVLISFMIRYALASNSLLKFDEIWSLEGARHLTSWSRAFFIAHDNNHVLNTIYLYFFGHGSSWASYRWLSVISGTVSVGILGWIGFQKSKIEGTILLLLSSLSFPLIIRSSLARGYAPAMMFTIIAYCLWLQYGKDASWKRIVLFGCAIILGILSHTLAVYIFAAILASSFFQSRKPLLKWNIIPSMFIIFWYFFFFQKIHFGGGSIVEASIDRFSLFITDLFNWPFAPRLGAIILGIVYIGIIGWIMKVCRNEDASWSFFGFLVALLPPLVCLLPLPVYNPDYLSLVTPFFLIILASILTKGTLRRGVVRYASISVMALYCVFGYIVISRQVRLGNGDYIAALRYIASFSRGADITIASDHDFRHTKLIAFYAPFTLAGSQKIHFVTSTDNSIIPEWLITHAFDPNATPDERLMRNADPRQIYHLERTYKNASIASGWTWFIYRHASIQ